MMFVADSEKELVNYVWDKLKGKLKPGFVCGLKGELGSGKTTLVKGMAKNLGLKGPITSPTFNVRKTYPIKSGKLAGSFLQHIDLYRFQKPSKIDLFEIAEWLKDNQAVSFIEWPENIPSYKKYLSALIVLKDKGKTKREVKLLLC